MKVYAARIGGRPIAAQAFESLDAARRGLDEQLMRHVVESNGIAFAGEFEVCEASDDEARIWRAGCKPRITAKRSLEPGMNPLLFFDEVFDY